MVLTEALCAGSAHGIPEPTGIFAANLPACFTILRWRIRIAKSRYDTEVMSPSELARRLNLPASRMRKAVADGVIRPCGEIGHNIIVVLTDEDLETLHSRFKMPTPSRGGV